MLSRAMVEAQCTDDTRVVVHAMMRWLYVLNVWGQSGLQWKDSEVRWCKLFAWLSIEFRLRKLSDNAY